MTEFFRLIKSDYYGIFKRKKLILPVLIIGWILCALAGYAYSEEGGFYFTSRVMSIIVFVFLFLFAAIAVSSVVNNNYSCGLAAKKLSAGNSRDKIYLSSLCTSLLMCLTLWVIFVLPVIILSYLGCLKDIAEYTEYVMSRKEIDPEFYEIAMKNIAELRAENAEIFGRWIGYFAVGLLSVSGMCAFFTFISFSIRSGFGVRLLCLVIVLVAVFAIISADMLPQVYEYETHYEYDQFGNLLYSWDEIKEFIGIEKNVLSFLVLGYLKLFPPTLMITPDDPFGGVWTYIVVAIVLFAASTAAGIAIFRKKNLK